MSTALDIITDALQELGVVGSGDSVAPEDAAMCLRRLNQVLQLGSNSRLVLPILTEIEVTLTGLQEYTVGPSGAVVAQRPIKVNSATALDAAGMEYPVGIINADQWGGIFNKNVTGGPPSYIWYEATSTNGTVHVYPKSTGYTLVLACQTLLTSFASTSTSFTLPDGYETLLGLMLADSVATAYGRQLSPDSRRRLMGAMSAVKRANTEPLLLSVDDGGETYQIGRGY